MSIYENIKTRAREQGKTVSQLETELGFPRSSIVKFDKNAPSITKVQAVARTLGSTTSELLGEVSYSSSEMNELIRLAQKLDPEDLRILTNMARRMAGRPVRRINRKNVMSYRMKLKR